MTADGPVPTAPAVIRESLVANVSAQNPGFTSNLPGSLIEDIVSTDVAAIVLQDQARVEIINSLNPKSANAFIVKQFGSIYGIPIGGISNTSVFLVFTQTGGVGFAIPPGFTVTDGSHQYRVVDGGIIGSGGTTLPLFARATVQGSWSVPQNSVTAFVTSVPSGITLAVNNPVAGTPGGPAETETQYRARVLQAGLASAQGMPRFVKTLVSAVPGVQARLVAMRIPAAGRIQIIVGGSGDPYQIAYAIFRSISDLADLQGATASGTTIITTINDYPDIYTIPFVLPFLQTVGINVTWNTPATSFVSPTGVAQLTTAAMINYILAIPAGAPINLFELQATFQQAISPILDPNLLTRMVFSLTINGVGAPPVSGTGLVAGDPEGYFVTDTSQIVVTQG